MDWFFLNVVEASSTGVSGSPAIHRAHFRHSEAHWPGLASTGALIVCVQHLYFESIEDVSFFVLLDSLHPVNILWTFTSHFLEKWAYFLRFCFNCTYYLETGRSCDKKYPFGSECLSFIKLNMLNLYIDMIKWYRYI